MTETQTNTPTLEQPPLHSSTNVYIQVPMEREVVSIRVRPEVKQALKTYCKANGLSLCHVFEGLAIGFLQGVNQQIEFVNKSPTMNLTVVRDVKRVRRYAKSFVETVSEEEEIENRVVVSRGCGVCGGVGYAIVTRADRSRVCLCRADFEVERNRGLRSWKVLGQ